jgi:seryl-tRNA synthetase
MLDIQLLRKQLPSVIAALARRGFSFPEANFLALEQKRKDLQIKTEQLQASRNQLSKQVGMLKAKKEDASHIIDEVNQLANELNECAAELQHTQKDLDSILLNLPNIPDASVPDGQSEADNQIQKTVGQPDLSLKNAEHTELATPLGLNFEAAARISGARFSVLTGKLATLHRALVQFMLTQHLQKGYQEVYVPYMVNAKSMQNTGQLPKFEEDLFKIPRQMGEGTENFYLIPTAEVPITNLVADQILNPVHLPIKYVAHTPCFRSEAGSHGRDTKGMIRQHQFDKVELVQIVTADQSMQALEALTTDAEHILELLKLPYRRMLLCAGDMGFGATKTYDLEVWIPSQQTYREISSCSNMGNFQARRMQARYKNAAGEIELCHTLNGSALAVGRTLVAILENYQQDDGSILVPDVLKPYCGFDYLAADDASSI